MKRLHVLAVVLFVFAVAAIASTPKTRSASAMQCSYIGNWSNPQPEYGCVPIYTCGNQAAWPFGGGRCYVHWDVADAPNPCNEQ